MCPHLKARADLLLFLVCLHVHSKGLLGQLAHDLVPLVTHDAGVWLWS